ncbi:DNA methyltransferase [Pannus brasiliensis CCIBt3594]|uniref:site-specific DNA-methyltransferase (adenine-specific) n=1 Tax=Pannus brasiliensis CCIBt3594 TaxID=1427578 RepID=A0AAW9R1K9_9CHRO
MSIDPEIYRHKQWLGLLQPVGLVVSPIALSKAGVIADRERVVELQQKLRDLVIVEEEITWIADFPYFFRELLDWDADDLLDPPDELSVSLTEYGEVLAPTHAVRNGQGWLLLIQILKTDQPLDGIDRTSTAWKATAQAKFERLLRETGNPIGLLTNGSDIRLVYAPRGESSGYLTFPIKAMTEVAGRPILAALDMLLGSDRLFTLPSDRRLPKLLEDSRAYQAEVSTKLAEQVLDALWELLRGFQKADSDVNGKLLQDLARNNPQHIYGGLITTLMRLVFLLYAEDEGLMPDDEVYQCNYSVGGLYDRLREDASLYPDTMDRRYGAWAWLLSLFRLVHDGGGATPEYLPARHGQLFDPSEYPFLENNGDIPRVPDGVVYRLLDKLLILDGERLSYRSLDVEQIGSVYEAIMGYTVELAARNSIGVNSKPKGSKHSTTVVVDLDRLLQAKAADRVKILKDEANCELPAKALKAFKEAKTETEMMAALDRKVSRRTPNILRRGSLYLQPTEERRKSGSHYTPRSLTQPIVEKALEPVFARLGANPTAEQILDLKICDLAMGSGAFLVEACRQLAEKLVVAWDRRGETPSEGGEPLLLARRLIAQRCLYGVDKNPFAVNLAKLSLWLVTLAKDYPFTFLDHALKCGDSLVGVTRAEIGSFAKDPLEDLPLMQLLKEKVERVKEYRHQIQSLDTRTDEDTETKAEQLQRAERELESARLTGDVIVSAFFEGNNSKQRTEKRQEYATMVRQWRDNPSRPEMNRAEKDATNPSRHEMNFMANSPSRFKPTSDMRRGIHSPADDDTHDRIHPVEQISRRLRDGDKPIIPFNWEIEFPEVFDRENGGFDCIVGNPPFAGKNTAINAHPEGYMEWLKEVHPESHGNSDIVAHFFRRSFTLLRDGGTFGLIATNTIAQGDTRATGLRYICNHGTTIYQARKRLKWPGLAAVVVSVVHGAKKMRVSLKNSLDGKSVPKITAFLFHDGGNDDPKPLIANAGKSFQGSIVLGMGFTFDDTNPDATSIEEMHRLIAKDPRNQERIFPYIGGEEVNSSPTHSHHRYVINFGEMTEEEARRYPDLMAIVEEKVKPERAKLGNNRDAIIRKTRWWLWGRYTPALFKAIAPLDRVLFHPFTSKYVSFVFLPNHMIYAAPHIVFPLTQYSDFMVLQSRIHENWARFLGSSMKDDLRYTPSDCFETFPFPENWETNTELEEIGREYYQYRARLMIENNQGLTETYNRFHDPDETDKAILRLRELHEKMDRAVLKAYGWTDIPTDCQFLLDYEEDDEETSSKRKKPYRYRWPEEVHDEVLARLLVLNQTRHDEEVRQGKVGGKKGKKTK